MLLDQLQSDLYVALKARDQIKVDTLRFLLGAIFNFQIDKGKDYVATDNDVLNVVSKQVKTHKESIDMFNQAGRKDFVSREQSQLAILQSYLPTPLGEEEIKQKIEEIKKNNPGADFGSLMKLAMGELRGKADGGFVAKCLQS